VIAVYPAVAVVEVPFAIGPLDQGGLLGPGAHAGATAAPPASAPAPAPTRDF
jgi:hypothetical protein